MKYSSIFISFLLVFILQSCKKEDENENQAPDTSFSLEEINLSGEKRLNSIVRLSWYGIDPDGYIKGYELSRDGLKWDYTTVQDSTFRFSIASGSDTTDIQLFVRAIDNNNLVDPTPDKLIIPIRNTPPVVSLDEDLTIPDTAVLAATTQWKASDIDGNETITQVLISLNGASWYELNKTKTIFTIVPSDPTATGSTTGKVYFATDARPANKEIEGLLLNDTNYILIKAVDQAGTESKVDTSSSFYMKGKQNDLLVVGGIRATPGGSDPNTIYAGVLNNIGASYDYLSLTASNALYQPKLWNVTFRLQLSFYSKLFFYSDDETFINNYTNTRLLLLEYAAASLQEYANNGGKYLVSTSFPWDTNIDGFKGTLPISSLSSVTYGGSNGTIVYKDVNASRNITEVGIEPITDSSASQCDLSDFPQIRPTDFSLPGVAVFNIDTLDSRVLYKANVYKGRTGVWNNTKIVGSGRPKDCTKKLNQIFFSVQLWQFRNDPAKLNDLFNQIINVEFN